MSKKASSKRCFILDLSFPEGAAVNEGILKDSYLGNTFDISFPRVTFDDLVALIKIKGKVCHLFKRDLKRAYRQF